MSVVQPEPFYIPAILCDI